MFTVVDVTQWPGDEVDEQLGTKEKSWLRHPGGQRWLFKEVRSSSEGIRGEDWAEKVVAQLAQRVGLPVATVELAMRAERRGIISQNFVPDGARLEHGNELLVRIDADYDKDQTRRNDRYTVDAIEQALADASPPDAYVIEGLTAFDIWAGYVALDAWVAGRDRHHENWGVIAGPEQRRVLAPSFDHGNALGFQESDERCQALVSSPASMEKWAARGTSHHFAGRPTLVEVAHEAMRRSTDAARSIWLPNIASVTEAEVAEIVDLVPSEKMSEPSRNFCKALLMLNQRRLCDVD